ncbi:FAD-binding oxidoreductase [Virgibacillus oceani]|uniref:FAD-binding protein n=1 Tax=Virgibacillus oceani TaxID=1479511 RepID=A0A917M7R6_9BACI|nr:FAD-dependent oxidoreductase [Virgibacillus oceani]GGG82700.1 FAD-binding protein [Virgibacillus oceani]
MDQRKRNPCPDLTGRIVIPGAPEYNEARLDYNFFTSQDKFPSIIVYCQNTKDVSNAIGWARCHNVPIRIRSGGHNHESFSTGTGVIVIDVSEMKRVSLDKSKGTAIVEPGVTGQELYETLYKEGFTQVGGTCPDVGISGLVLSGGMGPLLRRHGLTCDTLLSAQIVDADGRLIRATENNKYKDLFWALRGGGGGNFGVVVSITIKVFPAKPVTWFNIGWDWNQPIEEVIDTWQEFFSKADRRWFSHLDLWSKAFPTDQFDKLPIKVLGVYYGPPEEARKELSPFLNIGRPSNQEIELVNWNEAIQLFDESTAIFISEKPEYKSPGAFAVDTLPPAAIKTITKTLRNTTSPYFNVLIFSLGGAYSDIAPTDTAFYYRKDKFFLQYTVQWIEDENASKRIREVEALRGRLLPYTGGDYVGNPDSRIKDYLTAYFGGNADRLMRVKRKYDPNNVFHFPQSIPPAPASWDYDWSVKHNGPWYNNELLDK